MRLAVLLLTLALPAQETPARETKVVHMVAERFAFVPSNIKVKRGAVVEFRITSEDTNHGFHIPKAGINAIVPKRGRGEVKVIFRADESGEYAFECSKACGAGHTQMRGVIVVE